MISVGIKQSYLESIRNGAKTLEIRVGDDKIRSLKDGDELELRSSTDHLIAVICSVRSYPDFSTMLGTEDHTAIVPGKTLNEVKRIIRDIYPADRERLGVYVLEVSPVI